MPLPVSVADTTSHCPEPDPIERALEFQDLLDRGVVDSKAELARAVGLSRPRVSIVLNLLNLDEDIKSYILELVDDDSRLMALNEKRSRQIAKVRGSEEQKAEFRKCLMSIEEPL